MNSGDTIGPYVIHSSLGSGGMGRVYRARDTRLGRDVALKQLSDLSLTSDVARERVLQEARAAAALSHPNIATIFDVLDTAEGPAIVMEYVPGESLARHVARGPIPVTRALEIAAQISEGLADAHARGIVHRDLKPANIQITPDGRAKILDFGIARLTAQGTAPSSATTAMAPTAAGRLAGTPGYMAPEQLGGGRADERTDIYALGVLMYEVLTGRQPYPAADLLGSAMAVMKGGAPPVAQLMPGTPPIVSGLVERAMAKDVADRFQTAGELSREIQRASLLIAVGTASDTAPARPRQSTLPSTLALAAMAVIILAALGWQWVQKARAPSAALQGSVLAVLPFTNTTGDPANEPIAVGLTDAVANRLSSLQTIRVLPADQARESARDARGDSTAAARALGARFVVEGAVRRSGQMLDVDVSLVGADAQRRPAGRYTGDIAQALELHQRIAQGVIAALRDADAVPAQAAPSPAPTSNQQAFAEYEQARLFLEGSEAASNIDHAIGLFQSAINKDRRFALAYAGLGQAYWAKYRQTQDAAWPGKATTAILDGLRIDPDQPGVRLSLAVMYQGNGELDKADEELRRVLALQPWNDDAHRLAGGVHIERGQWDAAVASLGRAIELRPNYWRNHSELGYAHYRAGRHDDAARAYERVVALQPDSAIGFQGLGTVHHSAGRLPEALLNYTKAGEIRPRASTYSGIGTIHFWQGDYAKAAAAYQRAIELPPVTPGVHANLGDTLQKLGRRDQARGSYREAVAQVRRQLAVNENDAENLALLAMCLAKLEERGAADAAAAKALALTPEAGAVLYTAAMVDALAGRRDQACARLGQAVSRGASQEVIRRSDELRVLKGCSAYDRVISGR